VAAVVPECASSRSRGPGTAGTVPGIIGVYVTGLILELTGPWAPVLPVAAVPSPGLLVLLWLSSGEQLFDWPRRGKGMLYVYATVLTLCNLLFWVGILFNLPGTWLMVLLAAGVEWWQPGEFLFSWTVLAAAVALALVGELLEFVLGAAGSRQAGGSRRAAGLAIVGGVVGAILGTAIPVPILGTLVGASLGAFAGSLLGDLWAGRPLFHSVAAGRGAAVGRFWGTVAKMAVGGAIVLLLGVAAFF
jgi:hypothetical protein